MYETFFGFNDSPFSIAPDPRYLYMSERHQEALAHLLYGLEREGGFVLLTGEVGTGKTTICRKFLQNVPENTDLAFVLYPKLSAMELLATICDEISISRSADATIKQLVDLINQQLLSAHAQGKHTALIIDEAQNLTTDVLEQLRLLTNLETDKKKLLQIILLGQPELNELLQRRELRQLSQRVTARYHLGPLSLADVGYYITFRLHVAGCKRELFRKSDIRRIHSASRGIPRLINLICDRALLGAYSRGEQEISSVVVKKAITEVHGQTSANQARSLWPRINKAIAIVAVLVVLSITYRQLPSAQILSIFNNQKLTGASGEQPDQANHDSASVLSAMVSTSLEASGETNKYEVVGHTTDDVAEPENGATGLSLATKEDEYLPFEEYQLQKNNISNAYSSLFNQWQLTSDKAYQSEVGNCNWAAQRGLECLHRSGNWRSLLQLNRPVVLVLINQQGVRFRVTLTELSEQRLATIELDGRQHQLSLATLDRYWYGQYSLIWKVPPYKSRVIKPGTIQDKSEWLTKQLDLLDSLLLANGEEEVIQKTLKDRVKSFQQAVGIQPDGIPGTITVIMLNSWTQPDTPLLMAEDKR
jgi:general secretion pathway protein A